MYKIKKTPGDTSWFVKDRFGMFIHFGLYSLPARHEWVKSYELISEEKYQKYFDNFNPDLYDPREWAKYAKNAGMKYVVLTTKHHDGFCLFDSKFTDYKSTNTPCKKDLVKEYVEAFRNEGIHVGFYYSLIDWHHPQFPIDMFHPRRNDIDAEKQDNGRNMKIYAEYMRNQVTELLTNYGKIDILWFDFSYTNLLENPDFKNKSDYFKPWMQFKGVKGKNEWEAEELIKTARSLQPHIIIDNRTEIEQDIVTPEQFQPEEWVRDSKTGEYMVWEACQTFSGSWGYHRDEQTWKSPEMLISMLIKTVSLGGNLIMNVGPTSRGYFDERAVNALNEYGKWMKYNSRSIYNCTMAEPEFIAPKGTYLTQSNDGKRLYIHLLEYPFAFLSMKNLAGKIEYAQFLNDGSEVLFEENKKDYSEEYKIEENTVVFNLPPVKPNTLVPVIEIILK